MATAPRVSVKTKFVVPVEPSASVTSETVRPGFWMTSGEFSEVCAGESVRVAVALMVRVLRESL